MKESSQPGGGRGHKVVASDALIEVELIKKSELDRLAVQAKVDRLKAQADAAAPSGQPKQP